MLTTGFENAKPSDPKYDPYSMQDAWTEKYDTFPGWNCRITACGLFGDFITVTGKADLDQGRRKTMSENRTRFRLDQRRAPIYEALEQFRQMRVVPFDVPGHKRGRGNPELTAFLGQQCVGVDVNSMKPLDNLCHPVSVIREAEELAADAFGAAHAF